MFRLQSPGVQLTTEQLHRRKDIFKVLISNNNNTTLNKNDISSVLLNQLESIFDMSNRFKIDSVVGKPKVVDSGKLKTEIKRLLNFKMTFQLNRIQRYALCIHPTAIVDHYLCTKIRSNSESYFNLIIKSLQLNNINDLLQYETIPQTLKDCLSELSQQSRIRWNSQNSVALNQHVVTHIPVSYRSITMNDILSKKLEMVDKSIKPNIYEFEYLLFKNNVNVAYTPKISFVKYLLENIKYNLIYNDIITSNPLTTLAKNIELVERNEHYVREMFYKDQVQYKDTIIDCSTIIKYDINKLHHIINENEHIYYYKTSTYYKEILQVWKIFNPEKYFNDNVIMTDSVKNNVINSDIFKIIPFKNQFMVKSNKVYYVRLPIIKKFQNNSTVNTYQFLSKFFCNYYDLGSIINDIKQYINIDDLLYITITTGHAETIIKCLMILRIMLGPELKLSDFNIKVGTVNDIINIPTISELLTLLKHDTDCSCSYMNNMSLVLPNAIAINNKDIEIDTNFTMSLFLYILSKCHTKTDVIIHCSNYNIPEYLITYVYYLLEIHNPSNNNMKTTNKNNNRQNIQTNTTIKNMNLNAGIIKCMFCNSTTMYEKYHTSICPLQVYYHELMYIFYSMIIQTSNYYNFHYARLNRIQPNFIASYTNLPRETDGNRFETTRLLTSHHNYSNHNIMEALSRGEFTTQVFTPNEINRVIFKEEERLKYEYRKKNCLNNMDCVVLESAFSPQETILKCINPQKCISQIEFTNERLNELVKDNNVELSFDEFIIYISLLIQH